MKGKILFSGVIILGILFLVCGSVIILINYNNDSNVEDKKIVNENNTGLEYIKDYSDYNNFSVVTNVNVVFEDGYEWNVDIRAKVDLENALINVESYDSNSDNYVYYILKDNLHYYSLDGINWEKNANDDMILPDYSSFIKEIKRNKEVIEKGNNEYFLEYKYELVDGTNAIVPINVLFNQEGYLQEIQYDLTNIRSDYTKYIKTRSFSNVNNTTVIVPNDVINNAIQGNDIINLGF